MAGAGYKLFNTGDVLTAAQVNTYLQEQTVMVFANSTARTTALSGVLAEGMMSYLQDTNSVEVYNGSSWVNVGNAGDITEVQAGVGISIASGTGPIPVITNSSTDLITTAGDILYGTAADTMARLGIGTAGQVLKVNSGATAPEWGAAAGGGMTSIASGTLSSTSTLISSIPTTYNNLVLYIDGWTIASTGWGLYLRLNDDSNSNRYFDNIAFAQNGTPTTFNANHMKISRDNYGVTSSSKQFTFVEIPLYANTTSWKLANYYSISQDTSVTTSFVSQAGSGFYNQTAAITSIRILNGASATQSGNYALYGVK